MQTTERQSKYCQSIQDQLTLLGHATNTQLLTELRKTYPTLSATTVHRATARLASRGTISQAPPALDGSMRYDSNIVPHDHFHCTACDTLRDARLKEQLAPILESAIEDCSISGQLTISGKCNTCKEVIA